MANAYTLRIGTVSVSLTLAAAAGAVAVTGQDVTLRQGGGLVADAGSVAVTGTAATLKQGYLITAAAGSVAVTGTAATLTPSSGAPSPSGTIRLDTRAGGAQDIQAGGVTTIAQALAAAGMTQHSGTNSVAFTTDVDGAGGHAFRYDWPGVAAAFEVGLGLDAIIGEVERGEVYAQWSIWQTRTASGGGIGTAGDWDAYSQGPGSGKRLVWRNSIDGDGRFTFAPGQGADKLGEIFIQGSYNPADATTAIDWDAFVSQWITITVRLKNESSDGAGDGIIEIWFNDTKIYSNLAALTYANPWTNAFELGGPTWIGVPQDQTMYVKDIVIWQAATDTTPVRDVTTPQTGTGATAAVTKPANLSTGDLVLVYLAHEGLGGSITAPSGFSPLLTLDTVNSVGGAIYGKIATGSEPSTYDFTIGTSRTAWSVQAALVTGSLVDLSSFPSSVIRDSDKNNASGTSVAVPELTSLGTGDILLGHVVSRVTSGAITSSGAVMKGLWPTTTDLGSRTSRGFMQAGVTGSTGTRTFEVAGGSSTITAGLLALKAP